MSRKPFKARPKGPGFIHQKNLKRPTKPCRAVAGSIERIDTYRARFERGEALFDKRDNPEVIEQPELLKMYRVELKEYSMMELIKAV